jgi:hypothetical protein
LPTLLLPQWDTVTLTVHESVLEILFMVNRAAWAIWKDALSDALSAFSCLPSVKARRVDRDRRRCSSQSKLHHHDKLSGLADILTPCLCTLHLPSFSRRCVAQHCVQCTRITKKCFYCALSSSAMQGTLFVTSGACIGLDAGLE